jgi:hypothetical protein
MDKTRKRPGRCSTKMGAPLIPRNKLTIIRNRQRARDLARFREVVERFFEKSEYVTDEHLVDWEGARAARAQINRMLPRVIQIVTASGLEYAPGTTQTGINALNSIFDSRDPVRAEEEILDLIDLAMGAYQADHYSAMWRTVNPVHYVGVALGFVLGLPRKGLVSIGLAGRTPATPPLLQAGQVTRLEDVANRLADGQDSIEIRLAELGDRQERRLSKNSDQIALLAERLEFAERMIAQSNPGEDKNSEDKGVATTG